jgi:hypothetical protein
MLDIDELKADLESSIYAGLEEFLGPLIPAGVTGGQTTRIQDAWQRLAKAIAKGVATKVVPHIQDNAEVTVYVEPADTGLQTSTNPTDPTAGPAGEKILSKKGTVQ